MKRRLAIITEIIAPYRIPVFNELAAHPDIDLHVIFLAETDPTQYEWMVKEDEIRFSYEILPSWRKRIRGRTLLLNRRVADALRRFAPETILCGGYNYFASWQSLRWARTNHVPFWLWTESTEANSRSGAAWAESLKARFINSCDGFVVPGRASADYVKRYGVSDEAIILARNAVDTDFFSQRVIFIRNSVEIRRRLNLPKRFFLFVGRLVREKGVFDLFDAYKSLPENLRAEVGLVFVGDGNARVALENRARAEHIGAAKVTGFLQQEEVAAHYALAEIFVFPTHTDAWGLVVNEAMSAGLPVICTRAAGCVVDLVEEGGNGRVVSPHDVPQLVAAMEELARNRELALQFGIRSREIIQHYSPVNCAAGIAEAVSYKRLAA